MRIIAGTVVFAFALAAASSVDVTANAERIALARAEAALVAAAEREARCPSDGVAREARSDAGCAAEDAPRDDTATQPAQQTTPATKPASGVCGRNPETGRRKCSVRYLA